MKATINSKELLVTLNYMSTVLPKSTKNSSLIQDFWIDCRDNRMKIVASNVDITIVKYCRCDVIEEGTICVDGRNLISKLGKIKEQVSIETDERFATFKANNVAFKLELDETEMFPIPNQPENHIEPLKIREETMKCVFSKLYKCMSTDKDRAVLMTICMKVEKDKYVFAATDGRKAGQIVVDKPGLIDFTGEILIQNTVVDTILKNTTNEYLAEIDIIPTEHYIYYEFMNGTQVIAHKLEWKYPNYQYIFENQADAKSIGLSKKQLIETLNTCLLATDKKLPKVTMSISNKKVIKLESSIYDREYNSGLDVSFESELTAKAELTCTENSFNTSGKITFNSIYMLELLESVDGREIKISTYADKIGKDALYLTGTNKDERYLLMPFRS